MLSFKIDHEVEIVRYFVATSVIESGDVELGASIFSPPSQACFRSPYRRACLSGVHALYATTAHAGELAIAQPSRYTVETLFGTEVST